MEGFVTMRARYAGVCTWCGGPVLRGEEIGYKKQGRLVHCGSCRGRERTERAEERHRECLAANRLQ